MHPRGTSALRQRGPLQEAPPPPRSADLYSFSCRQLLLGCQGVSRPAPLPWLCWSALAFPQRQGAVLQPRCPAACRPQGRHLTQACSLAACTRPSSNVSAWSWIFLLLGSTNWTLPCGLCSKQGLAGA